MLKLRVVMSSLGNSNISKSVERGTLQGGVISPLLWLIVVNSILVSLENKGLKIAAYADDIVIPALGQFLDVISGISTGGLGLLSKWATACGLGVNPNKTELVLYTKKIKIPSFRLPMLRNCEIPLSKNAKYFVVTSILVSLFVFLGNKA